MIQFNISKFQFAIQQWYEHHHRILPWRDTQNPYKIWISEIILQQTRVNQGMDYYLKFIEQFPTVSDLAKADEQEVLKLWQGLGYYSRARNLHKSAKIIQEKYNGKFPDKYEEIIKLSGIGEYTAAAIASFAFNLPYAAVDGNVNRVLARITGTDTPINSSKGKKEFQKLADKLLDKQNPGLHNQAMIEFGALQCTPTNPDCTACVINDFCKAYQEHTVEILPVKIKKTSIKERYFYYFHITYKNFTFLQKREERDIWKNLYEFPLLESAVELTEKELLKTDFFKRTFHKEVKYTIKSITTLPKHILSHQHIFATFYSIVIDKESKVLQTFTKVDREQLESYPISRLTEKYLEKRN